MNDETKAPTPDEVEKARAWFENATPAPIFGRQEDAIAFRDSRRVLLAALDAAERETGPRLAKHQPCGCVVCTCEYPVRCGGCGAHMCDRHRGQPYALWRDPGAVFEAHPLVERAEAAEARVAELERERDAAQKRFEDEQYAHAMGCPGCCNAGGTHPHSERAIDEREEREAGWIFDPTRYCPQGCSVAVADTGEYEWMCGCDLVPCEVEGCVHGAHLTERNALRRERDEARESSEAWRTRFRGVAGALRAFLASQPQTEKVRETIEALERDLGWKEVPRG